MREALQRLQQEGFVVGAPGAQQARLTVAPLTRADVHELLNIVGELEGLGARWAAALEPAERRALAKELRALNAEFHKMGRGARSITAACTRPMSGCTARSSRRAPALGCSRCTTA